jgi:hypothetical protein
VAAASSSCAAYFFKHSTRPKLLVVPAIDSLPQRQITHYRDQLILDGPARFLERGTCHPQAVYSEARRMAPDVDAAVSITFIVSHRS